VVAYLYFRECSLASGIYVSLYPVIKSWLFAKVS